jgi:hypothetical protein
MEKKGEYIIEVFEEDNDFIYSLNGIKYTDKFHSYTLCLSQAVNRLKTIIKKVEDGKF